MKPPWQQAQEQARRQQEQMRKQQEELRRRQQMGAWYQQQQKAKAEKGRGQAGPGAPRDLRFDQLEAEVARLRRELAAGGLSEAEFTERVKGLRVQDARGAWWMIGPQTGKWYRYSGTTWLPAQPPGQVGPGTAGALAKPDWRPAAPRRHRFWAAAVFLLGLALTYLVAQVAEEALRSSLCLLPAAIALILTIVFSWRLWQGS